jgi:hypothetical protein
MALDMREALRGKLLDGGVQRGPRARSAYAETRQLIVNIP